MDDFDAMLWTLRDTEWIVVTPERPYDAGLFAPDGWFHAVTFDMVMAARRGVEVPHALWQLSDAACTHLFYFPYHTCRWTGIHSMNFIADGVLSTRMKHKQMRVPPPPVMLKHRRAYMSIEKALLMWLGFKGLDHDTLKMVLLGC